MRENNGDIYFIIADDTLDSEVGVALLSTSPEVQRGRMDYCQKF